MGTAREQVSEFRLVSRDAFIEDPSKCFIQRIDLPLQLLPYES